MSMAIKYAMMKKHKMARGGCMAEGGEMDMPEETANPVDSSMKKAFKTPKVAKYAEGGHVDEKPTDEDIIGRIIMKRLSKGGEVANATPITADFKENEFDDMVLDDDLEEHYTGENSGDEIGNKQEDEDRRDVVSRIMKSRKKKDHLPHPM